MDNKLPTGDEFLHRFWEESWVYIKTVVDVIREPILILDKDFRVMAANEPFYRTFQVEAQDTENKIIYDLGNGQWNIPTLKKLLENILPMNTFFKGFEVTHEFPIIGKKIMILNARRIHANSETTLKHFPPIILLAIEDVTEFMRIGEILTEHSTLLDVKLIEKIQKLEKVVKVLEGKNLKLTQRKKSL